MYKHSLLHEATGFIIGNGGLDAKGKGWVVEILDIDDDKIPFPFTDAKETAKAISELLTLHYPTEAFNLDKWLESKGFKKGHVENSNYHIKGDWEILLAHHQIYIYKQNTLFYKNAVPKKLYLAEALFELVGFSPF